MSHIHTQRRSTHSFLSTVGHTRRKGRKEHQIRKKIIDDLIVFINKLQANNHESILTVDVNETFESGKGGVTKLSSITNLVDPIACTHGFEDIPKSRQRGAHRNYFIFISPKIPQYICSYGITPFSEVDPSDYRVTFIVVDLFSFLQKNIHNISYPSSRLLQSNAIKLVSKYRKNSTNSSNKTELSSIQIQY